MKGFFSSSIVHKKKPEVGSVAKCGACGLYRRCQSPKIPVQGQGGKGVLIVGDFPTSTDDETGSHFSGTTGGLLRQHLAEIGVKLDRDCWYTNALICHPTKVDERQVGFCRPNLMSVIDTLEPDVIITMGRYAMVSIIGSVWKEKPGSLDRWVGWTIPLQKPNAWICPTYHPTFLEKMKNSVIDSLFMAHLEEAFRLRGKPEKREKAYEDMVDVVYDDVEVSRILRRMDEKGGIVGVDYEANCLKPDYPDAEIVSCSVSWEGKKTISYPWKGEAISATGDLLRSRRTKKVASNLKMEERWTLKFFGHGVSNWWHDTMVGAHCIDNRQAICSLKFQSFVVLGQTVYNDHIEPYLSSGEGVHYNRIHEIEMSQLLLYGGLDSLLEVLLAKKQREILI